MQLKKSQVLLTIASSKKVADLLVSISVPFQDISDCCLPKLKFNCGSDNELMQGSEEAALAFALYETIRDKLAGSALETFKTKVSNVMCHTINNYFVITFHTQSTGTSLRKTCGIALSCFNAHKLFTKYSENIKFLSGKGGKRKEFNYVANKFSEGVKKSIIITAVGKFPASMDKDKLKDIVDALAKKVPELQMVPNKEIEVPGKREAHMPEVFPIIKCNGLAAAITADYIRNTSGGMSVAIIDEGIVVYNNAWPQKQTQLKDTERIKDYIEKKYSKLQDAKELSALFAYYALSEGFINSDVAEKVIMTPLQTVKLIELVKKTLQ